MKDETLYRALKAVNAGRVVRRYTQTGNVLIGPDGVSSQTLWKLDRLRFIDDAKGCTGTLVVVCRQALTKKGEEELSRLHQLLQGRPSTRRRPRPTWGPDLSQ